MDFLRSVAVPDIVIVTPIVPNHMEQFQTLEAYRDEKLKLLRDVRHVLVHESLRTYVHRSDLRTYGSHADASLWVGDTQVTLSGTSAVMHGDFGEYPFRLPSIGAYQAENIAPVFFVAQVLGLSHQGVQRLAL